MMMIMIVRFVLYCRGDKIVDVTWRLSIYLESGFTDLRFMLLHVIESYKLSCSYH